jgi:hypothetical protein
VKTSRSTARFPGSRPRSCVCQAALSLRPSNSSTAPATALAGMRARASGSVLWRGRRFAPGRPARRNQARWPGRVPTAGRCGPGRSRRTARPRACRPQPPGASGRCRRPQLPGSGPARWRARATAFARRG